jgi:Flp pilus assembly protein TadD
LRKNIDPHPVRGHPCLGLLELAAGRLAGNSMPLMSLIRPLAAWPFVLLAMLATAAALAQRENAPAPVNGAQPVDIVTANGRQTEVWLDGEPLGLTPVNTELPPGVYFLTAYAEGLEPVLRPLEVRAGGRTHSSLRDLPLTDARFPVVFEEIVLSHRRLPDNAHILLIAANLAADPQDYASLIALLPPGHEDAATHALAKGRNQVRTGDLQGALATIDEALARHERVAGLWRIKTRLLTQLGRPREAVLAGHRAVGTEGLNAENFVARGLAHLAAGSVAEGREDLQRALELDPGHPRAQRALADTYAPTQSHATEPAP